MIGKASRGKETSCKPPQPAPIEKKETGGGLRRRHPTWAETARPRWEWRAELERREEKRRRSEASKRAQKLAVRLKKPRAKRRPIARRRERDRLRREAKTRPKAEQGASCGLKR